MLEATETKHFLAESLNTDGSRGLSLTSAKVGLSSPFSEKEEDDKFLKMDGRAIFDFAIRDVDVYKRQIPVVPSVALAKRMEKLGADAVIAEGMEAGGHIGKLTTMTRCV